jgi:hypothetical protein
MSRVADALQALLLTLWIGGLWVVGYLVAPTLFATLPDRQLAGQIAGRLFEIDGWLGLVCAAYLLLYFPLRQGWQALKRAGWWLVLLLAVLTALSLFGVQPLMAQLKLEAGARDVMESVLRDRFVAWHGIASILYLVQSLLGLALVVWNAGRSGR